MDVNEEQLLNVDSPILSTNGIVMDSNEEHPENA